MAMRPRFSIAGLITVVALCGVAFAALFSPSQLWANAAFTMALASLVVAAINLAGGRGRPRAFWAGFLIAGAAYFVPYCVPALREATSDRLLTEPLLDLLYPLVAPPQPPPSPMMGGMPGMMGSGDMGMMSMMGSNGMGMMSMTATNPPTPPPSRWATWTEPDRSDGMGHQVGTVYLGNPGAYRQIGHSLATLLVATLGGLYARYRYERREAGGGRL